MNRLYSFVAVALLIGLGLGLIYLYTVDRISALGAVATVLAAGTLMVIATALADSVEQERHGVHRKLPGAH
jgi:hypothetical protein